MQAGGVALQRTRCYCRAARVGVGTSQDQLARVLLDQATRARHHTRVRTIRGLIKEHLAVVEDSALQAGGVALQRTRCYCRAARVGVGTGQDPVPTINSDST